MDKAIITVIIFFMLTGGMTFGEKPDNHRFRHLTVLEGLSQNHANSIIRDHKGFIWIATGNGLNRYDGRNFKQFFHNPNNPQSLSHNYCYRLLEVEPGILWIGTLGGGLNRMDIAANSFTRIFHSNDKDTTAKKINDDFISALYKDNSGNIWIGTLFGGLYLFDSKKNTISTYFDGNHAPLGKKCRIFSVFEDSKGVIWIGTENQGLFQFDKTSNTFKNYKHHIKDPNSINSNRVTTIYEGTGGELWIGTMGGGLNKFNREKNTFRHYIQTSDKTGSDNCRDILTIKEDSTGTLWLGTLGGGLVRFNKKTNESQPLEHNPNLSHSISNDNILSLYEDPSAILWVGTFGGINLLNRNKKNFKVYSHEKNNPNSISEGLITAICQDKSGDIWLSVLRRGLERFNRKENKYSKYSQNNSPGSLSSNLISVLLLDSANRMWIGTNHDGLNLYIPETDSFETFRITTENSEDEPRNSISAICESSDGSLWIGTRSKGGLNHFDPKTKQFKMYRHSPDDNNSVRNFIISTLLFDSKDNLWIGYNGGGISIVDKTGKTFTHLSNIPMDSTSLSSNNINTIRESAEGIIWVGTNGGGLNRFDKNTQTFTSYSLEDGLPDNVIGQIQEDTAGNLWLSTNKGLAKFTPQSGFCKGYSIREGLYIDDLSTAAFFKSTENEMFLGGSSGFTTFFPENIQENTFTPPVTFTDLKLRNVSLKVGPNSILNKDVSYMDKIELDYTDKIISFEVAALDYTVPSLNSYQYKLEGLNENWINLKTKNEITLTDLDPGSYKLTVIGSNNDGKWNFKGKTISIRIRPPYWQTWWFRLLVVLLLVFILWSWHKQRMKRLTLNLKTEAEMSILFEKYELTEREQEITRLILKGKSNQDIEEELYIALKTVKNHVSRIYKKMGVKNRLELINQIQKSRST